MGVKQSNVLPAGASVDEIVNSETRYAFLDLSAWHGSSVSLLILTISLVIGLFLIVHSRYSKLKRKLSESRQFSTDHKISIPANNLSFPAMYPALAPPPPYNNAIKGSANVCYSNTCGVIGEKPCTAVSPLPRNASPTTGCQDTYHQALESEKRSVMMSNS